MDDIQNERCVHQHFSAPENKWTFFSERSAITLREAIRGTEADKKEESKLARTRDSNDNRNRDISFESENPHGVITRIKIIEIA